MSDRSRSRSNSPFSASFSKSKSRSRSLSPVNTIASAIKIPIKSNEEHSDKIIEGISPINNNTTVEEDKKQKSPEQKSKDIPVYFTRTFKNDRRDYFNPIFA